MKKSLVSLSLLVCVGMHAAEEYPDISVKSILEPIPHYILEAYEHNRLVKCDICKQTVPARQAIPHAFQKHAAIIKDMLKIEQAKNEKLHILFDRMCKNR